MKTSLAPLLIHVATLPEALRRAELEPASTNLGAAAEAWVDDIATARDLVGRLLPPPRKEGRHVRELYELGTMLFGESARSLQRLDTVSDMGARVEAAQSGRRLHVVADRVFDQAKRLLDLHGDLELDMSVILPTEVPDFDREGPGSPGGSVPAPKDSGFADRDPPTIPPARWGIAHRRHLDGVAAILKQTADFSRVVSDARQHLARWSGELRAASRQLAGPVPETGAARQASFVLRLSLLVESEALAVLSVAGAPDGPTLQQAQRLRLIGDRLWMLGRELFAADGVPLPPPNQLPDTGIDPTMLRRGGMFNGHPPPLQPGDPPGTGVPGGLRVPDPNEVFPPIS